MLPPLAPVLPCPVLPLAEPQSCCTLKEATIVASVMARVSVPVMHAAAAMLKLSEMPYNGATSLFLRVLLNKKYSLPYRVIDGLVAHFLKFGVDGAGAQHEHGGGAQRLPVLWHQALLVFAQRYKTEVTAAQKEALKPLLRAHYHHQITPEIRRELFQSLSRGQGFCDEAGREHGGARKKARTVGAAMRD